MDEHQWQQLQYAQQYEITRAFHELHERWQGIFAQEGLRLAEAGMKWQLATRPDGWQSWEPYPKPFDVAVHDLRKALDDMRKATDMRVPYEGSPIADQLDDAQRRTHTEDQKKRQKY